MSSTDRRNTYLRPGDRNRRSACAALTLHIRITGFTKGNQTLRASTGGLGSFIGVTSMAFDVHLGDARGQTVLEYNLKKSKRGDSDSLKVAQDIAKNIAQKVDKAMASRDTTH